MSQPSSSAASHASVTSKEQFLRDHPNYGYGGRLDSIYSSEFSSRLGSACYLDHAGSGLYTDSHLRSTADLLSRSLLLNPHSDNRTAELVDGVREDILKHLGTDSRKHSVVFTYNASAALALLGDIFPFSRSNGGGTTAAESVPAHACASASPSSHAAAAGNHSSATASASSAASSPSSSSCLGSELAFLLDNHNSALGMREKLKAIAGGPGARFSVVRPVEPQTGAEGAVMECACSHDLLEQYRNAAASGSPACCPPSAAAAPSLLAPAPLLKLKGKVSRALAAKTALSMLVDALGECDEVIVGESRDRIERRIKQLETGTIGNSAGDSAKEKLAQEQGTNSEAPCPPRAAAASPQDASAAPTSASASPSVIHRCLFVYPAESNFDGRIYETTLAKQVKEYNFPVAQSASASAAHSQSTSASASSADSVRSQQTARAYQTCSSNPLGLHHHGPLYDWFVCVDASKFLSTSTLDLSAAPEVDFVVLSFYKMFGYPTGLAALVVRNDIAQRLWGVGGGGEAGAHSSAAAVSAAPPSLSSLRRFFSGGTVNAVLPTMDFHALRGESSSSGSSATSTPLSGSKLHELLEDGTVAFTSILALPYGLQLFARLTTQAIHEHTTNLADHLFQWMRSRRYEGTEQPIVKFYGAREAQAAADDEAAAASSGSSAPRRRAPRIRFGPVLNFNFLTASGGVLGYKSVEKVAAADRILFRSGSFCNPGACMASYPMTEQQIKRNLQAGLRCWDDGENLGGLVNGSLRISLGWSSRIEDVQRVQQFVAERIVPMGTAKFITHGTEAADAMEQAPTHANGESAASTASSPQPIETRSMFADLLPAHFTDPPVAATVAPVAAGFPAAPSLVAATVAAPPSALLSSSSVAVATAALSSPLLPWSPPLPASPYVLSSLTVYPIKSCAGVECAEWWILQSEPMQSDASGLNASPSHGSSCLFLDREFVLLDAYGSALSQKTIPHMQLIQPAIDVSRRILTLRAPGMEPFDIRIDSDADNSSDGASADSELSASSRSVNVCSLRVCGSTALGYVYDRPADAPIVEWLSKVIGKYTALARKSKRIQWPDVPAGGTRSDCLDAPSAVATSAPSPSSAVGSCLPSPSPRPAADDEAATAAAVPSAPASASVSGAPVLAPSSRSSFANENDYLLVSAASVRAVQSRLHSYVSTHALLRPSPLDSSISPRRFRPNFVLDSGRSSLSPFEEDGWTGVGIGPFRFRVAGGCARCTMVNVDPESAQRQSSLFALLHQIRKNEQGKIMFGTLLSELSVDGSKDGGGVVEKAQRTDDSDDPSDGSSVVHRWWPIRVGMGCAAETQ